MKLFSSGALFVAVLCFGCHSKEQPAATAPAPVEPPAAVTQAASDALSSARGSLQAGKVDEAAANLAKLQMQAATFNSQQAKQYRQTMSEAYDRAIEAAQRGDPRGQAALQLLRAAAPH